MTITAGCILNCLLEHVAEFTVVRKVQHNIPKLIEAVAEHVFFVYRSKCTCSCS